VSHGILETVAVVPGVGGLAKASKASGLIRAAGEDETARLATWADDFAKDRFITQVAKREHVMQLTAGAERAENLGHRLDRVAAVGASGNAWFVPHLMPHPESHAKAHEQHRPNALHLEPLRP
jgi:hypothetical protein